MYRFSRSSTAHRPLSRLSLTRPRFDSLGHRGNSDGSLQSSLLTPVFLRRHAYNRTLLPLAQHHLRHSRSAANPPFVQDEDAVKEDAPVLRDTVAEPTSTVNASFATFAEIAQDGTAADSPHEDENKHVAGFWPLRPYEQNVQSVQTSTGKHVAHRHEIEQPAQEQTEPDQFRHLWAAVPRPRKIDLSYWNTLDGEASGIYPARNRRKENFAFRADHTSTNGRGMTKFFMQHIYRHVSADHDLPDDVAKTLIQHPAVLDQPESSATWPQALCWSWILLADSATSVKRLAVLTRQREFENLPPVPLWVIMQLLRSSSIDAESLTELLVLLTDLKARWAWSGDEPMLLTVRLLRHARMSAPICFEPIAHLFFTLLRTRRPDPSIIESKKICHWCNRVLSLLAIPTSIAPFRSMQMQQTSQLALVRYMQDSEPQIPLMREAYRAIARVQLMHPKTEPEKEWARAKSLTWPPWEKQNQMGSVITPSEYSGKSSRVVKVLERMQETGYAPYEYDRALRILTGWDTDNSPTIQVRRTAASILPPTPWLPESKYVALAHSPLVWCARVEATRTVREAWMCFCSYHAVTQGKPQSPRVYHAMFRKLFAQTLPNSEDQPLPGDGTEVYHDPELARDRVYIPEEIPSVQDLFSRMITRRVRPSSRLLSDLLKHETSLHQGLHFVSHADMEEEKRKVLSSPENYGSAVVANVLKTLPQDLVRSYVGLLSRPHSRKKHEVRPLFEGRSGPRFVKLLLESMGSREVLIWNEYFRSLRRHLRSQQPPYHKDGLPMIYKLVSDTVAKIYEAVPMNFTTFTYIATIAFKKQTSINVEYFDTTSDDPVFMTKQLFERVACGHSNVIRLNQWQTFCTTQREAMVLRSIPTGDAIEAMVWVLGSACTENMVDDILALLHWVRRHQKQIIASGHRISVHNSAAFRAFLEGSWADAEIWQNLEERVTVVDSEQRAGAQRIIEALGTWPDDQYMQRYMLALDGKFKRVRNKYKSSMRSNANTQGNLSH